MTRMRLSHKLLACFVVCSLVALGALNVVNGAYAPAYEGVFHVYLTLSEDTAHEMVVNFQFLPMSTTPAGTGFVYYDVESHNGRVAEYAFRAEGPATAIEGLPDGRFIFHVRVTGLEPGIPYFFVAGSEEMGFSEERVFRTVPEDADVVRFVQGGDMRYRERRVPLLVQAAAVEPMFAVLGGDMAHGNGRFDRTERWDHWFEDWCEYMVTPSGYTVPIVAAIGNHEVNDHDSEVPAERAPYFVGFFGQQGDTTYCCRRFGACAAVFVLDSDHIAAHDGPQADWLAEELARTDAAALFAVYHKPMYPAHRDFDGDGARNGRTYWQPLFDAYGVDVAFEHHDHVFKRTYPIRANVANPQGTVYVGDGCFGEEARMPARDERWYLERAESRGHFWVVDVTRDGTELQAVDGTGEAFDVTSRPLRAARFAMKMGTVTR